MTAIKLVVEIDPRLVGASRIILHLQSLLMSYNEKRLLKQKNEGRLAQCAIHKCNQKHPSVLALFSSFWGREPNKIL